MATERRQNPPQRPVGHREKLKRVLHSHTFHIAIVVLVILDCILVIAELIIDLQCQEEGKHNKWHTVSTVLHYMSVTILSIFMVEITLKVYAHGLEFFRHWLEVVDAFIVTVSFILDVVNHHAQAFVTGLGLLVLLRLWRVTRIVHGIVVSVKAQSEFQLEKEVDARKAAERETALYREYCVSLETANEQLRGVIRKHGIPEPATPRNQAPRPKSLDMGSDASSSVSDKAK